jgi:hypothetical protein
MHSCPAYKSTVSAAIIRIRRIREESPFRYDSWSGVNHPGYEESVAERRE